MPPAIIAHYFVAIAVIAVFLAIALTRGALLREAAARAAFAARYGCEVKA